ncbi:helix-turn-helix transcriptional regulator [Paenibacillus taichungensis]|uniref:Helix-turn-helix transcriptional regulator n=1 Tax=Paenibacillus taichungensis TaxID=484184 RepID=A0ABX2MSM4_9BACL|nr:helix-turn-helix transcriptional regulator [Paenibacillus taichungensis]NUU57083.1 helix-turn-helix transcriptional regulator [Paenibacillus taichungensis]
MIKLRLKLDELLKEHNITQSQLSKDIEVRQATLSEMSRNIRSEINIPIIEKIANHFDIKDIHQLIELIEVEEEYK